MLRTLLVIACLVIAAPAAAQPASADPPTALAQAFFSTLKSGDALKAYGDVWRDTMMSKRQADLENIANQTESSLKIYGKISDWQLIKENKVSKDFIESVYIVRTEQVPLFFKFQFYHAPAKWVATNISFTDTYKNVE